MAETYHVCAGSGYFADDVATRCALCDRGGVHRPTAPAGAVPICARCAVEVLKITPARRGDVTEDAVRAFLRAPGKGG